MQEFRDKQMMGHAFRRCGFKIQLNEINWRKKCTFLDYFFFLSIEAMHLRIFWP